MPIVEFELTEIESHVLYQPSQPDTPVVGFLFPFFLFSGRICAKLSSSYLRVLEMVRKSFLFVLCCLNFL